MASNSVKVVLLDDHAIARLGIMRMLETAGDIHVVAVAATIEDAITEIAAHTVDVAIVDISIRGGCGLSLLCWLRSTRPEIAVLILSAHCEEIYGMRALKDGAAGYLTKDVTIDALVTTVRRAALGERHLSNRISEMLVQQLQGRGFCGHSSLSKREFEVMLRVAAGVSITAIGVELFLSPKTISTYRSRIFEKLGIHTNAELTRYAMEEGLIPSVGPWIAQPTIEVSHS